MDKESLILEMRKSFYFRNYTTWFDFRKFYNMVWFQEILQHGLISGNSTTWFGTAWTRPVPTWPEATEAVIMKENWTKTTIHYILQKEEYIWIWMIYLHTLIQWQIYRAESLSTNVKTFILYFHIWAGQKFDTNSKSWWIFCFPIIMKDFFLLELICR